MQENGIVQYVRTIVGFPVLHTEVPTEKGSELDFIRLHNVGEH